MKKKYIFILFGLMLVLLLNNVGAITNTSQQLCYRMDDADIIGSVLEDVFSSTFNLTIQGAVTTGLDGILAESFRFDANTEFLDRALAGTQLEPDTGDFTVNFWYNTTTADFSNLFSIRQSGVNDLIRGAFFDDAGTDKAYIEIRTATGDVGYCQRKSISDTDAFLDGAFHMFTMTRNGTTCADLFLFLDGSLILTAVNAQSGSNLDLDNFNIIKIDDETSSSNGRIDEFSYFLRALEQDDIDDLYNSGSALSCSDLGEVVPPPAPINTTIQAVEFNVSDLTFGSTSFITADIIDFNTTGNQGFSLLSAFNILKLSIPGSENEVIGRILVDDVIVTTELLRTVSGVNTEGSSGFFPLNFSVTGAGKHNITIQFSRTGNGNIQINDFDFQLIKFLSGENLAIRNQQNTGTYTYNSTSLLKGFNWTIDTTSDDLFIIDKQTISGTVATITNFQYNHTDHNHLSPFVSRYIASSSDVGSTSNNWKHNTSPAIGNFSIMAQTSAGIVTVNVTVIDFDLQDSNNNTINSFQLSNSSTTPSSPLTLTAGSHLILEQEFTPNAATGDSFILLGSMSFQSNSGSQTPTLVLNTTNTSLTKCFTKKERSLAGSSDIGNVYAYTTCDGSVVVNDTYTVQMWVIVETGQTIFLRDESFSGFQTELFSITETIPPPVLIINNDLVNNTDDFNDDFLPINYNLTIGTGNTLDTFNCSLIVNSIVNETQFNRTDNTSYLFNYSVPIVETDFTFELNCSNSEITTSTGAFTYRIDRIEPNILPIGIVNNTIFFVNINHNITANVTCEDVNLFSCNSTIFEINTSSGARSHAIINNFTLNLTGGNFTFNFTLIVDSLNRTQYEWFIESWDDHNPITGKHEKAKDIFKTNNYFKLGFDKGDVEVYSDDTNSYEIYDEDNKYKIEYEFKKKTDNRIYLKNSDGWTYRIDSEHKAHFVSTQLGKYFDLDSPDITIKQVKEYQGDWEITLDVDKLKVKTNSIGDLNRAQQRIFFNVSEGFTFFADNNITGLAISNFTINILNGTALLQSKNTTVGNLTFNITEGLFRTNITSVGFANNNTGNLTFSVGDSFFYQLFAENSLFLFFYREDGGALINDRNVTVKIINLANTSSEATTDTGSTFVSGFAPGDYELLFNSSGFLQNQFFTTITSSSTQIIDLYLVSNETGTLIVFNWADEKGRPITNAIMQRLRLVRIADNAFILTGMSRTDENGETSMNLDPNTVFYRFRLQDEDGDIVFSGGSQQIFSNLVFFRVELIPDTFQSYALVHGGEVSSQPIDWDNVTNIVSFTWNDATGQTRRGCIQVIQRTVFAENLRGPNCVNSSGATVQLNMSLFIDNSSQYIAQGFIDTGTRFSNPILQTLSRSFGSDFELFGNTGLFIAYLFITSMFLLGITISFSVSVAFTAMTLLVTQLIGVTFFGWSLIIGVTFVGIIVAVVIKN